MCSSSAIAVRQKALTSGAGTTHGPADLRTARDRARIGSHLRKLLDQPSNGMLLRDCDDYTGAGAEQHLFALEI